MWALRLHYRLYTHTPVKNINDHHFKRNFFLVISEHRWTAHEQPSPVNIEFGYFRIKRKTLKIQHFQQIRDFSSENWKWEIFFTKTKKLKAIENFNFIWNLWIYLKRSNLFTLFHHRQHTTSIQINIQFKCFGFELN